ncbi:MAG: aminotransferase class V-fold PLP-dependent enzyme [Melioribacteraceae bacterium]|nr:aminotransferase class V-fold PLP-dependent enzyme [Melioribacteraceae bacterium]
MTIEQVREQFPYIESGKKYFNHASIGPLSKSVSDELNNYIIARSRDSINNYNDFTEFSRSAKKKLGKILNCGEDRIAWVDNVSNALNVVANGLDFLAGDRIILFEDEFPSNIYPFLNLERKGVKIDFVKIRDGRILLEDIAQMVTAKTKLLSISAVQFLSGFRADLESIGKLCKENNLVFCVDAIQAAGVVEIDVQKFSIDFLAGGAQKWLMSLQGSSYFYMSPGLQNRIKQMNVGWTSVNDAWNLTNYDLNLKEDTSRYENGTLNAIGITALNRSLDLFLDYGLSNVYRNISQNTKYMRELFKSAGVQLYPDNIEEKEMSGIVTCRVNDAERIFNELNSREIICSLRQGMLRFSPHFYNTSNEIEIVADQLSDII